MDPEFLELCGFEPGGIETESPRIGRAFDILGLGDEDIARAKTRIVKYIDVELPAMRKILGLWVKELADMVLAREDGKKVVYVSYPPIPQFVAAMALTSDDVYCAPPDIVLSNTLNLMFDRINPVLETAERNGLAPDFGFCSYLQTRLGAIVQGIIPRPDLLIPSCFLCDLTPATDQLLREFYGTPVAYIDNLIDVKGERWPEDIDPRKVKYFAAEMRAALAIYSEVTGHNLLEEVVREAVSVAGNLMVGGRIRELHAADPLPLSLNETQIIGALGCIGRGLKEGPPVLARLGEELEKRVAAGRGVVEKGAPRVMLVMIPHDPSLVALIGELGLAACVTAGAAVRPENRPVYDDLWEDVAVSHMLSRGANYSSLAYITQLKESVRQANVEGIIFFRHFSCRQYSIFPFKAKETIEKEMGIPVLLLEGDYCDFRSYTTRTMRTKLETFADIVKNGTEREERTD